MNILKSINLIALAIFVIFILSKLIKNKEKIGLSIICFYAFFGGYYIIISTVSMGMIFILDKYLNSMNDGAWVYSIILGVILSPILSIITTIKLINKDKWVEILLK